jgi:hypothetical protein
MSEHDQLDLVIILEIVRYLRQRREGESLTRLDTSIIAEIVSNVSSIVNIESLSNSHTTHVREALMNDQYKVGQAGAVGPGSVAMGQHFIQLWNECESHIDLDVLAQELHKVRETARGSTSGDPEEDVTIGELAQAEVAAKQGDGSRVLRHLAGAGQRALDIAVAIGVPVAIKAIETAIGGLSPDR